MSRNRGPLFNFLAGKAPQELTASLTYISYAKRIDKFWMDGRIFYIFFLKSSELNQGYNEPTVNAVTHPACA